MNAPDTNQAVTCTSVADRFAALTAACRPNRRTSIGEGTENDGKFGDSGYGTGQHPDDDDGCYTE